VNGNLAEWDNPALAIADIDAALLDQTSDRKIGTGPVAVQGGENQVIEGTGVGRLEFYQQVFQVVAVFGGGKGLGNAGVQPLRHFLQCNRLMLVINAKGNRHTKTLDGQVARVLA
jgi:hypothetical protein